LALLATAVAQEPVSGQINSEPTLSTLRDILFDSNFAAFKTAVDNGALTFFAPTNAAFTAANIDLAFAQANVSDVTAILEYHLLAGTKATVADLQPIQFPATAEGTTLRVTKAQTLDNTVRVNNVATVTIPDFGADPNLGEAVIHVIDAILFLPSSVSEKALTTETLSTLSAVLEDSNFAAVKTAVNGGASTVFAPDNAAFTAANVDLTFAQNNVADVTAILQYHLVTAAAVPAAGLADGLQFFATAQGNSIRVVKDANGVVVNNVATVTTPDVMAGTSYVHVVDAVLQLPPSLQDAATSADLDEFLTAVSNANFDEVLGNLSEFTVFAWPNGTANGLLDLTGNELQEALAVYVLNTTVFSTDLADGEFATSLNGQTLTFTQDTPDWFVNGVLITSTDRLTTNGVIHTIAKSLYVPGLSAGVSLHVGMSLVAFLLAALF